MADVEAVGKNRKNKEQGYAYRGIDDLYNSLHRVFARHRVFITCDVIELQRTERATNAGKVLHVVHGTYRVTFHAEDGSAVSVTCAGEAMDTSDKATNKASSAALKYALMQTLLIPTEETKDSEEDTFQPEIPAAKPTATDAEVARCAEAIRTQRSNVPAQQLNALRTLTPDQVAELEAVLADVFHQELAAAEAPADRPVQLPRQRAASQKNQPF